MKRIIVLTAAAAAVAASLPAASPASVPSNVRASKLAFAAWSSPIDARGRFTQIGAFALTERYQDSESDEILGGITHSKCVRVKRPRMTRVTCWGIDGVGGVLSERQFQVDPALNSARLSIRKRGELHEVRWSAEDVPGAGLSWEACWSIGQNGEEETGEGQGAFMFREARAEGRALGRKLESRRHFAALMSDVALTECRFMSQRSLDALAAGDFDRVRYTYAFPR